MSERVLRLATTKGIPSTPRVQMPRTLPSAALAFMSEEDRARLLESAVAHSSKVLRDYMAVLDARLRVYEQPYEVSSADLVTALESGLPKSGRPHNRRFYAVLKLGPIQSAQ
jgi:hypothetical protein